MKYDVTAIVTTHAEGSMVVATIQSCLESVRYLESKGANIEVILVMDRPNNSTRDEINKLSSEFNLKKIEYDFGDQGLVRNNVIAEAKGQYIAFLDGDDLWSENWLFSAFQAAEGREDIIFYPEFNWFFEGSNNVLCQVDSSNEWFDYESLRSVNLWDALCFCPKKIYRRFPFSKRKITDGFAYEDWNWNRCVYEAGIAQKIVKDTIIFKRRRDASQSAHAQKRGVLAEPTSSCYFSYDGYK